MDKAYESVWVLATSDETCGLLVSAHRTEGIAQKSLREYLVARMYGTLLGTQDTSTEDLAEKLGIVYCVEEVEIEVG